MHPVDEFAALRAEIAKLEARADQLRANFLHGGMPMRSPTHEITVKTQKRRMFQKDRLPKYILDAPELWSVSEIQIVQVHAVRAPVSSDEEDIQLIEE